MIKDRIAIFLIPFMVSMLLLIGFITVLAESLSFLENNPELKARLVRWEQEAPEEVQMEIQVIRRGGAISGAYAAYSLRKMGDRAKGAILVLIEAFKNRTTLEWRRTIGGALVGYPSPTSLANEAAIALGEIGKPAVEPLIFALMDEDSDIRMGAARALGWIKDPRAVEPLIFALTDKDKRVRFNASEALGKLNARRAVEPLISELKDNDKDIRRIAALALGEIKDPRAIEPLISTLKDEASDVRDAAARALHAIDPDWTKSEAAKKANP
jgi:hypothetical protein